jgi:hypothetical protein
MKKNIDELTDLALDLLAEVRDLRLGWDVPESGLQDPDAVVQIRGIMSQIEGCLATFKAQE